MNMFSNSSLQKQVNLAYAYLHIDGLLFPFPFPFFLVTTATLYQYTPCIEFVKPFSHLMFHISIYLKKALVQLCPLMVAKGCFVQSSLESNSKHFVCMHYSVLPSSLQHRPNYLLPALRKTSPTNNTDSQHTCSSIFIRLLLRHCLSLLENTMGFACFSHFSLELTFDSLQFLQEARQL